VCKLVFIFLLGNEIDFGYQEAVNLLSSTRFSEKQIVSLEDGWDLGGRSEMGRVPDDCNLALLGGSSTMAYLYSLCIVKPASLVTVRQ